MRKHSLVRGSRISLLSHHTLPMQLGLSPGQGTRNAPLMLMLMMNVQYFLLLDVDMYSKHMMLMFDALFSVIIYWHVLVFSC